MCVRLLLPARACSRMRFRLVGHAYMLMILCLTRQSYGPKAILLSGALDAINLANAINLVWADALKLVPTMGGRRSAPLFSRPITAPIARLTLASFHTAKLCLMAAWRSTAKKLRHWACATSVLADRIRIVRLFMEERSSEVGFYCRRSSSIY